MNWMQMIDQAEARARAIVVVGSPEAAESRWVMRDIDQALSLKLPIFPVLLRGDSVNAIPVQLRHLTHIDLRENLEEGALRLEHGIRAILGDTQMVQIGEVHFPKDDSEAKKFSDGSKGRREISVSVTFERPFTRQPKVVASLQMIDLGDVAANIHRIAVRAEEVGLQGFKLYFETWEESQIYNAIASWTAVGE
jgi:hypothetical protein